jgi:hypothetical protein
LRIADLLFDCQVNPQSAFRIPQSFDPQRFHRVDP